MRCEARLLTVMRMRCEARLLTVMTMRCEAWLLTVMRMRCEARLVTVMRMRCEARLLTVMRMRCEARLLTVMRMRCEARLLTVILYILIDRFHLSLLAVRAAELQAAQLKGDVSVSHLNHVDQSVEVVGRQDEKVTDLDGAPPAKSDVAAQRLAQRARQVFIKDGVQIVVVDAWIPLQLGGETCVGAINTTCTGKKKTHQYRHPSKNIAMSEQHTLNTKNRQKEHNRVTMCNP